MFFMFVFFLTYMTWESHDQNSKKSQNKIHNFYSNKKSTIARIKYTKCLFTELLFTSQKFKYFWIVIQGMSSRTSKLKVDRWSDYKQFVRYSPPSGKTNIKMVCGSDNKHLVCYLPFTRSPDWGQLVAAEQYFNGRLWILPNYLEAAWNENIGRFPQVVQQQRRCSVSRSD